VKPVPVPEPVSQPEPVAVEPKPEPLVEEPVRTLPKGPRHTAGEVKKRWHELSRRVKTLPDDQRRAARRKLEEARFCALPADQCWRDLTDIEKTFFAK
jgi:hypothetical protein